MKYLRLIILFLLVTVATAQADNNEWSVLDKSLFVTYTAFNIADILQTRYIFENDEFIEKNPILKPLGKDGSTAAMIGANVLLYFIADNVNEDYRSWALGMASIVKIGIVGHNFNMSIGFGF